MSKAFAYAECFQCVEKYITFEIVFSGPRSCTFLPTVLLAPCSLNRQSSKGHEGHDGCYDGALLREVSYEICVFRAFHRSILFFSSGGMSRR